MLKMKKIIPILIMVVLLFNLFSVHAFSFSRVSAADKINCYNIDPSIWASEENHSTKVEMCQLGTEQIQSMTTEELVNVCLEYPFLIDMFAYNTLDDGFHAILDQSDAFKELSQRSDAASILLDVYSKSNVVTTSDFNTVLNSDQDMVANKRFMIICLKL